MRKFILIASLVLMSANVQAGQTRGLVLASNDQPAPTEQAKPAVTEKVKPSGVQTTEPKAEKPAVSRRETDEAKARRIAARYGISW